VYWILGFYPQDLGVVILSSFVRGIPIGEWDK